MVDQPKTNPADTVQHWPLARLTPYARNSRTHSADQVDQIVASIREGGFTTAVLVDETGSIIAGHGRVLAASKMGLESVPVMVATGWTDAQKRAYVIADNKLAMNSGWDLALLSAELDELGGLGIDATLTGFTMDEVLGIHEDAMMSSAADLADSLLHKSDKPGSSDGTATPKTCPHCGEPL